MRLLSVDPGRATGWFCVDFTSMEWVGGELAHDAFLDWMEPQPRADNSSPLVSWHLGRVLVENFKIGPRTYQTSPTAAELWSVKQIGALEMWCRRLEIPLETAMPSGMAFDKSGSKLKALGWWSAMPGVQGEAGHRRAAAKHALKWGVDHRLIDLNTLL